MLHDHHQEEIHRRQRGIYGTDFDSEEIKPQHPSFWQWLWNDSTDRFNWFLMSILLALAAIIAELGAEGILVSTKFTAEQLSKPAILLCVCATINLALFIRAWRTHKYRKT